MVRATHRAALRGVACLGALAFATTCASPHARVRPAPTLHAANRTLLSPAYVAAELPGVSPCFAAGVAPKGLGRSGATIATSPDESLAAAADTDNDAVALLTLNRAGVRMSRRIAVGHAPAQVVLGSDGRAFVTERQSNTLSVYDTRDGRLLCRASTPPDPVGVALAPDERTVYVTSGIAHAFTAIDTATFATRFTLDVPREPRGIALSRDGTRAMISHLAGTPMSVVRLDRDEGPTRVAIAAAPIPVEHLHVRHVFIERFWPEEILEKPGPDPSRAARHRAASSLPIAGTLGPVDRPPSTPRPRVAAPTPARAHAPPPEPADPSPDPHTIVPLPSQAWSVAIDPDTDVAIVPFMANRTGREVLPEFRTGSYGAGSVSVSGSGEKTSFAIGVFDLRAERWRGVVLPTGLSDEGARRVRIPTGVAIDPRTHRVWVTAMGTNTLARFDIDASRSGRITARASADETITAPCGLSVLRDGRVLAFSQIEHAVEVRDGRSRSVITVGEDALPPEVAHGRRLFFSADDGRIASGGLSCGGCHPDGRDDGLVWFLSQGPRQTPTLAGRLEAPFNWNGSQPVLANNIVQTIHRLGGSGVKASEAEALAAYLSNGLRAPQRPEPVLTALEAHGRDLFEGAAACSACHDPERNFTDARSHVLGGLRADESRRDFDTPSLRFVAGTAPYFHDGRYATLRDVLTDPRHRMGHVEDLAIDDVTALEAYLRTL